MVDDITIDDLLLYSECPMKLFFSKYMGLDKVNGTLRGEVNDVIVKCCYYFLSTRDSGDAIRHTTRKFNQMIGGIARPSDVRGGGRRKESYDKLIHDATVIFENFMEVMFYGDIEVVASPLTYEYHIRNKPYAGRIDAAITMVNIVHIVTFNMSSRSPSEEMLASSMRPTIAAFMYRHLHTPSKYKIIDYWLPGNEYVHVQRTEGQYSTLQRELHALAAVVDECIDVGGWYRSKGFWCDSCYLKMPCSELRYPT